MLLLPKPKEKMLFAEPEVSKNKFMIDFILKNLCGGVWSKFYPSEDTIFLSQIKFIIIEIIVVVFIITKAHIIH